MSNDLIPMKEEMQVLELMAKHAADSKFFNNLGGLPGIFSIMLYAKEIGVPPMQALMNGMHSIQGKISLAPQLMNAMIRKAGHKLEIDSNDIRSIIKGIRKDSGESCEVQFSIEDAKRAGIYKEGGGWTKYPSDMCFARALSRLARRLFPDVIGTAYVEGEIEENDKPRKTAQPLPDPLEEAEAQVVEKNDADIVFECIQRFKDKECDDFPVSEYLDYCAKICKPPTTIRNIAEQALQRIDSFAETYKKWADMKMDEFLKQNKRP